MISSCEDCQTKCCKTGPGPYKKVKAAKYLEEFGTPAAHNTQCENLLDNGWCRVWGTPSFPMDCRVYVCQTRSYTKAELTRIKKVIDLECLNCGAEYMIEKGKTNGGYQYWCEVCEGRSVWKVDN